MKKLMNECIVVSRKCKNMLDFIYLKVDIKDGESLSGFIRYKKELGTIMILHEPSDGE